MGEPTRKKRRRPPPVYVEPTYPRWLVAASLVWMPLGWLLASVAPHLAFLPLVEVLHYLLPLVTVALIGVNAYGAFLNQRQGVHVFRLLLVTAVQVGLFTTLSFQIFAHFGAEFYEIEGPTKTWQWVQFSFAHALRATDLLDGVEAFSLKLQPIKHTGYLTALFVVCYHLIVDFFLLSVIWDIVDRVKRRLLKDDGIRGLGIKVGAVVFAIWFFGWLTFAFYVQRWRAIDVPLWLLENFLRVLDFADVMESFDLHLHTLPREGVTGVLTVLCRVWIALGITVLLGKRKKLTAQRALATPPDASPGLFWTKQIGMVCGLLAFITAVGLLSSALTGKPAAGLASAIGESDADSRAALNALRRMGVNAQEAIPTLVAARPKVSPATDERLLRTLGYLGPQAIDPLADIALGKDEGPALAAVDGLKQAGKESAPKLVRAWSGSPSEEVRKRADEALRSLGHKAVPALMNVTTAESAGAHYHWFEELDRNWQLRSTDNRVARAIQKMPDLLTKLDGQQDGERLRETLADLSGCGSAAKKATPKLLDLLTHRENAVQSGAANILVNIGPTATLELLERRASNPRADPTPAIVTVLAGPNMWDKKALAHPAALPVLLRLLDPPNYDGARVAIAQLEHFGPAAAGAVPKMFEHLSSPDEARRADVRKTLDRIDPNWKKHADLTPSLLGRFYAIAALPAAVAEELFGLLGPIPADRVDEFERAIQKALADLNRTYRDRTDKESRETYAKDLDVVFGPIERLGVKMRGVLPVLTRSLYGLQRERNDWRAPATAARVRQTIRRIAGDGADSIPAVLLALGHGEEGIRYLKEQGAKALPHLEELVKDHNGERWLAGLRAVAALGPPAEPLAPVIIKRLPSAYAVSVRVVNESVGALEPSLRALNAADPKWWGRPEAAGALADMLRPPTPPVVHSDEDRKKRNRLTELIGESMPASRSALPGVALDLMEKGGIDELLAKMFDKLDAKWRENPKILESIPRLVERMSQGFDLGNERSLTALGAAAVGPLVKAMPPGDSPPNQALRSRILAVLQTIGPSARDGVAGVLKLVEDPDAGVDSVQAALTTVTAVEPNWASDPKHKDTAKRVLSTLMKRGETKPEYYFLCRHFGAEAVGELLKALPRAKSRAGILSALGHLGPKAISATKEIVRLIGDKEAEVRRAAIVALGKINPNQPSLVAPVVGSLLDKEPMVGVSAAIALKQLDPDWRTRPRSREVLSQALKLLSHKDALMRFVGLGALEALGPLPGVVAAVEKMHAAEKEPNTQRRAADVLQKLKQKE